MQGRKRRRTPLAIAINRGSKPLNQWQQSQRVPAHRGAGRPDQARPNEAPAGVAIIARSRRTSDRRDIATIATDRRDIATVATSDRRERFVAIPPPLPPDFRGKSALSATMPALSATLPRPQNRTPSHCRPRKGRENRRKVRQNRSPGNAAPHSRQTSAEANERTRPWLSPCSLPPCVRDERYGTRFCW